MLYHVTVGSKTFEVELDSDAVRIDGVEVDVDLATVEGTRVRSLLLDGVSHTLVARRDGGGGWGVHLRGRRFHASVVDERTRAIREMTGASAGPTGPAPVKAPMPGLVVKVEVAEGDVVEAGRGVVIVEAMKMENELRTTARGRVARVHVAPGDTVAKDQILVDLEPLEGEGP